MALNITTDPTYLGILADVIAHPGEDGPRLVLADWLEERGSTEEVPCPRCSPHASEPCPAGCWPLHGIHVVSRDGRRGSTAPAERCPICNGTGRFPPGYHPERDTASGRHEGGWTNCKECNGGARGGCSRPGFVTRPDALAARGEFIRVQMELARGDCPAARLAPLRRRERELLNAHALAFLEQLPEPSRWLCQNTHPNPILPGPKALFRRGFVDSIICTCADWLAHGPTLVRSAPLLEVRLMDCEIRPIGDGQWDWFIPCEVPRKLASRLRFGCPWWTKEAAERNVNAGLLEWARSQQELPGKER